MKRYLVFNMDRYEPSGGWDDFHNDYSSLKAATVEAKRVGANAQVVDTRTRRLVYFVYTYIDGVQQTDGTHRYGYCDTQYKEVRNE